MPTAIYCSKKLTIGKKATSYNPTSNNPNHFFNVFLVAVTFAHSLIRESLYQSKLFPQFQRGPLSLHSPGLGSLVFRKSVAIRILLVVVRIRLRSGRRAAELSPVAGVLSPVPVPLSGEGGWGAALLPVLLRVSVVLPVFGCLGVTARVIPGGASVIHDDPLLTGSA